MRRVSTKKLANIVLAIVLKQQSLSTSAPTSSAQFSHHLSLLSSRADAQRRDSLVFLTNTISSRPAEGTSQALVGNILPKVLPLLLDGSKAVRAQTLKLLSALPPKELEYHAERIWPHVRAGMTHLAIDIRNSTVDVLEWAIVAVGVELVSCPGGWIKPLKCFLAMFRWPNEDSPTAWSSYNGFFGKSGTEVKAIAKSLSVLASFLRLGLSEVEDGTATTNTPEWGFPLFHVRAHMMPSRPHAYRHLNLFGPPRDEDGEMYTERGERQRIFGKRFWYAYRRGFEAAKKEGGEIGRAAALGQRALAEGMKDFPESSDYD